MDTNAKLKINIEKMIPLRAVGRFVFFKRNSEQQLHAN